MTPRQSFALSNPLAGRSAAAPALIKECDEEQTSYCRHLMGGVVGFLLRPSVPLMGQLPFTTVITVEQTSEAWIQLLLGYARTSFNYVLTGLVLGAVIGLMAAFAIEKASRPHAPGNS